MPRFKVTVVHLPVVLEIRAEAPCINPGNRNPFRSLGVLGKAQHVGGCRIAGDVAREDDVSEGSVVAVRIADQLADIAAEF